MKAIITSYPPAWFPSLAPGQLQHASTCSFLNQPNVIFMVPPIGVLGTERDTAVLLIASCWPSSILCRISTASLQCILHYFPPPSPHATQGEQMPVFHLAVPAPQCHLAQDLTPPLSPSPSPPSMTVSQQSQISCPPWYQVLREPLRVSHFESKLFVRGATPATAHGVFGAELEGEHSYFKCKCSVTAQ